MLAVCAGAEPRLDEILEALLDELAAGKDDKIALVQRCGLDGLLWEQVERAYGYASAAPGVRDFAIELFKSCYAAGLGEPAPLNTDALVFLQPLEGQRAPPGGLRDAVGRLRRRSWASSSDLQSRDYRRAGWTLDLFELIDQKILSDLARDVADRTLTAAACEQIIRRRRQSHWYDRYRHPLRGHRPRRRASWPAWTAST